MKFTDEYLKQQIKGCENYLETHEDKLIVNRAEWDWHMSINDLCAALKEIQRLRDACQAALGWTEATLSSTPGDHYEDQYVQVNLIDKLKQALQGASDD